jgi:hypothetical protein
LKNLRSAARLSFLSNSYLGLSALCSSAQQIKAPSYPLIKHDPYFSIGTEHALSGLLHVDGVNYRFLGNSLKTYKTILPVADEQTYKFSYRTTDAIKLNFQVRSVVVGYFIKLLEANWNKGITTTSNTVQ